MSSKNRSTIADQRFRGLRNFSPRVKIKNALRRLGFHKSRSREWGEDSRLLAALVSKETMCMNYELLNTPQVAWVWKDAEVGKAVAGRETDHKYRSTLGDRPSLIKWFRTFSWNGRSMTFNEESVQKATKIAGNGGKKKRFSWLPDADKRWPQGWC